jgi:signal transduction histidine kinase
VRRVEPWIAIVFFAVLAGLEIVHGVTRLDALRQARRHEIVDAGARALGELKAEVSSMATVGARHAAYVARLPEAAAVAGGERGAARRVLEGQLLALLASFPEIDRVRVLDAGGREAFRCERMGGGVALIPELMLSPQPDAAARDLAAALEPGGSAIQGLFIDHDRVEVSESERKVIHCVARPASEGFRGSVVLTIYASPMLDRVRRFAPIDGAHSYLVTKTGAYVAAPDREREIGATSASTLVRDHPEAAPVLEGAGRVEADGTFFLASPTVGLPWIIVSEIPESALVAATSRMTREHWLVIAAMLVTLVLIACAAVVFHGLALRAFRVREAEAALRQLEQQRAMERRLATADRLGSLGLLTAGVAHEVNNPLEGIGNYLALLGQEDLPPEKRKRYLESVRHGFERIRQTVRNLLEFGRPRPGTGSADLRRVIARAVDLARFSKSCREVTFAAPAGDDPVMVAGEEGALEQVVMNLFLNAGTAMGGRGRVVASIVPAGDAVELLVDDEGPGIPPEHLGRIFDPFFTTGDGSGLGLSVSYGIAQAHGGTLSAENLPGRGARFTLRLPAARPALAETDRR